MDSYAPALSNDETHKAVMDFCVAMQGLKKINDESSIERKEIRSSISSCKEMLRKELQHSKIECLQVNVDGEDMYVRLTERKTPFGVISAERFIDVIRTQSENDLMKLLEKMNDGALDNAIEKLILHLLCPDKKLNVSLSKKAPRGFRAPQFDANTGKKVQELASLMDTECKQMTIINERDKEAKQPLQATKKMVETQVSEHLKRYDPKRYTRRVKLAQGEKEWTYFLRHQETTKPRPLTLKNAMPIFKAQLLEMRNSAGIENELTLLEVRKLQSEAFLNSLQDKVAHEFKKASDENSKTSTSVTMNKFHRK